MAKSPILCPHNILGITNCKQCAKEYNRKYREKNRAKHNEYESKRRIARYRTDLAYRLKVQQRNQNKESRKEYHKAYDTLRSLTDKKKILARRMLQKSPKLYPLSSRCEFCGTTENLQHAHIDYDLPRIYLTACGSCNLWMEKSLYICGKSIDVTFKPKRETA